jgi:hypothetical protein
MLRKVSGRFAAAALEVHHGNRLQMLVASAIGTISTSGAARLIAKGTKVADLLGGVGAASACGCGGQGAFALNR